MDLSYTSQIPTTEFIERRQNLLSQMKENTAAIIFSAQEQVRNNDCHYPFRQDSYFWYLTGFNEPDSALLLIKANGATQSILFLRPSDPLMETWHGRRLGLQNAPQKLSIDNAYSIDDFSTQFFKLTKNLTALYHKNMQQVWGDKLLAESKAEFSEICCWSPILDEMRLFKSANEIALMQQAGQISALAHIRAMKQTRPNRTEAEIEGEILHEFSRFGAKFASYNSIVAGVIMLVYCTILKMIKP